MLVRYQTIPSFFNTMDEIFKSTIPSLQYEKIINPFRGVSVKDSGEEVTVLIELPGIAKEDVKVQLQDNLLTISAERKQPELKENEQWIRNEIRYGRYERTIELPYFVVAEKISATHENGILRIVLPKAEEAKPKLIDVKVK